MTSVAMTGVAKAAAARHAAPPPHRRAPREPLLAPPGGFDPAALAPSDRAEPGMFEAIYHALDASSAAVIGPVRPRLLAIPLRAGDGAVEGGLWGCTACRWLHVEMLIVPESRRGQGLGTALMAAAEAEARRRGCIGGHVDALSFQAEPFYRRLGYSVFGVLEDFPPGHRRIFFRKRFDLPPPGAGG